MRWLITTALVLSAAPAAGQNIAVSGRAGTLGLGAEVSVGLNRNFGVRGGVFAQPWQPSYTFDDIEYTLELASPSFLALLDVYPLGGGLRVSGGFVRFGGDHEVHGQLTGPIEVGNQTYTPDQIGTLSGVFETRDMSPYAGFGFGRLGGRRGLGFAFDLGVAFHGEPGVQLNADGPIASQQEFMDNLAIEAQNLEEDARPFRFYPVLSVGLAIGF
ncbi:MAG: hypothetical protein ACREL7_12950 [Longimicrobiales bacterium]